MDIRPIRTEAEHEAALREIARLCDAPDNSPEADRLEVLSLVVEAYEKDRWPIEEEKDPIEILKYLIETGRSQQELAEILGSASRASEVLAKKRALTIEMIDKIGKGWSVPVALLATPYALAKPKAPVKAKRKLSRRSRTQRGLRKKAA